MDLNTEPMKNQINPFSVASFVCGMLSITLCCTGVLSIPVGALGILFAILTKRHDELLPPMSKTGIILCITGILLGIFMTVYAFYMLETDPATRAAFQQYYKEYSVDYPF